MDLAEKSKGGESDTRLCFSMSDFSTNDKTCDNIRSDSSFYVVLSYLSQRARSFSGTETVEQIPAA